ncbi:type II toxin-antitoxin system VapC family toxin [Haloferula sp.]|uniref:type II toxin-antitoxin system VapC family toxin n=1 Tax=Haloferula sp. TaxID=2497595 RepID=UPI003C741C51
MKVLIDTDVLLDVALSRELHLEASVGVLRWAEAEGGAAVAWHSIANCGDLLKGGREFVEKLLGFVEVATVSTADAKLALKLPMRDFEDALQAASALAWSADFIVTRNLPDYRKSPVPAVTPAAFLKRHADSGNHS